MTILAPSPSQGLFQDLKAAFPDIALVGPEDLVARAPGEHADNFAGGVMAMPASTEEAARLIRHARENRIPVICQGGRTGLVGGGISRPGELILSTGKLTQIQSIQAEERTVVVQAGVALESLQQALLAHGLTTGIDLGSRGTATIGGMVSTNAGGILAFRNGVMRHQVLGLEAVLPDGSVYSDLTRVVKVSAGPDLKHLLIGGEGAFGFVTRVVLKLETRNPERATALIGVPSATQALKITAALQARPALQLEAAELMWRDYFCDSARHHGFDIGWLEEGTEAVLLTEVSGETAEAAGEALQAVLADLWEDAGVTSGLVAQSLTQARKFWELRENSNVVYVDHPDAPSFDVSLPPGSLDLYVRDFKARLKLVNPSFDAYVYGHMADGNLHISITKTGLVDEEQRLAIEAAVYDGVGGLGGSFSAEHGVGLEKRHAWLTYTDPVKRQLAQSIKRLLDPDLLFNPGKVPFAN